MSRLQKLLLWAALVVIIVTTLSFFWNGGPCSPKRCRAKLEQNCRELGGSGSLGGFEVSESSCSAQCDGAAAAAVLVCSD